jgi:hypothetical protein
MSMTDRAIEELERAGLFKQDSDYDGMIGEALKELLLVFQKQGHSGYSANLTAKLFHKLIKGDVLSPLTNDPSEWMNVHKDTFQSIRCSHVFIDKAISEQPYTIDGKAFSDDGGTTYFSSKDSVVYFTLPGYPPSTEYVILKEKEHEQNKE